MISKEEIEDGGHGWLLDTTILGKLPKAELAQWLRQAAWTSHPEGSTLVSADKRPSGTWLLLEGEVKVSIQHAGGLSSTVAHLGPGHLIGERSTFLDTVANATVRCLSPIRAMYVSTEVFRWLLDELPALNSLVKDLVSIRERSEELMQLLVGHSQLRMLGREDLERLLQTGSLRRIPAGVRIVAAGERTDDVYVLISGSATVYAPTPGGGRGAPLAPLGPRSLFGHRAAITDLERSADIVLDEESELLVFPGRAFLQLLEGNNVAMRRMFSQLSMMDIPRRGSAAAPLRGLVVTLHGAGRGLGATTLAYGVSAALSQQTERPVLLVDLHGEDNARRLGRSFVDDRLGEFEICRMTVSENWAIPVLWPKDQTQITALLGHLKQEAAFVLVSVDPEGGAYREAAAASDALIFVTRDVDTTITSPVRRGQFRVHAVRVTGMTGEGTGHVRHVVRVPTDRPATLRFWRDGAAETLCDESRQFGRACHRLARVLRGRTVGLALGGGGAWGFAHVGLIRALRRNGVPIDYVAGTSFGAVVAGIYAAGGLDALDRLMASRSGFYGYLVAAVFSLRPIGWKVDRLIGGPMSMASTEIPFLPVSTDIVQGGEMVLSRGSVGRGVQSSSGMPGLFAPLQDDGKRLLDGGIVNNVPASVVWNAGADFVLASNVIPQRPGGVRPNDTLRDRVEARTLGRIDDLLRAMYLLMWKNGHDRTREADYTLDFAHPEFMVYDFGAGDRIADWAEGLAETEMPKIKEAYRSDRTVHFARGVD